MAKSKFNPTMAFDDKTWLAHLVNTNNSSSKYFFGGHAAIFVEGMSPSAHTVLRRYDISAIGSGVYSYGNSTHINSSEEENAFFPTHRNINAFVHNIKVIEIFIENEDEKEEKYQRIIGNHNKLPKEDIKIFTSVETHPLTKDQAIKLHGNALAQLTTFIKGIIESFLTGKRLQGYDFFQRTEDLLRLTRTDADGNQSLYFSDPTGSRRPPIQVLLDDYFSIFWEHKIFLERRMIDLMKEMTSGVLANFYLSNLEKLAKHNAISQEVLRFKYTGPHALALHHEEDNPLDESRPVNCMYWCRKLLLKSDIDIGGRTNNPKKIGCSLQ